MLLLIQVKESGWKLTIWRVFYNYPNRILEGSELCIHSLRKKSIIYRYFCLLKNFPESNWITNPESLNRHLLMFATTEICTSIQWKQSWKFNHQSIKRNHFSFSSWILFKTTNSDAEMIRIYTLSLFECTSYIYIYKDSEW